MKIKDLLLLKSLNKWYDEQHPDLRMLLFTLFYMVPIAVAHLVICFFPQYVLMYMFFWLFMGWIAMTRMI